MLTGPETVNDFPENSSTSRQVARYTARDPEGSTVTLSLSSGDDDFNLASNGAVIFEASPDYEAPRGDSYTFTVRAVAGSHTVNKPVDVNIQNVEEPGTVTLSSVQPQENTSLTATLVDDDNPDGTTWQWYRTSSRGSTGTAITGETSTTYTPVSDDVGNYLRVVASYDDGFDTGNTAAAVSANRVLAVNPDNVRPEFPANGDYNRSIRENLTPRNLGAPVTATDENSDRMTYSILESDLFEINQTTGQLGTKVMLDHETGDSHTIAVTANDPSGDTGTVDVTITVEDVDETPVISGPSTVDFAEGAAGTVATYTATDPDDKGIDLMLTGSDDDALTLSGSGLSRTLAFQNAPNFEEKNSYRVTIEAHEQGDGTSVARLSVTIRITNVDEDGMVEVPVSEPRVGQQLTPKVEDPDGGVGSIEWKWESRESGGDWTSIPGATSRSYTPTRDDNGKNLRVTAIYRDRQGPGKTDTHEFAAVVVLRPYFPTDTATRTMQENTGEGRNVGGRFTASHPDNVNLTYSLTDGDTGFFTIDSTNGQLMTSTTALDYERSPGPEAEVQITATAPDNQMDIITVAITVTNVCAADGEEPCAPGRPSVRYDPDTDTNLLVSWSAPRSNAEITGYDLQYRESGSDDPWMSETLTGTDRSLIIGSLAKGTTYEVQVRASNDNGINYGDWSQLGTGTPGYVPPPPDPAPDPPTTTTTTTGGGGGGGGGGGFAGFAQPAPPRLPVATGLQTAVDLFQPLVSNGSLVRVWRLVPRFQRWLFYDPAPRLSPFYTLRSVNLDPDSPTIVAINVTRPQRFRGYALQRGWNYIPITPEPPSPSGPPNVQPVGQLFQPLIANGNLGRIWWLDSATQEWNFYDPRPEFASFNSLKEIDLSANPPVVLVVSVLRGQRFRGQSLYRGWNYIVLR